MIIIPLNLRLWIQIRFIIIVLYQANVKSAILNVSLWFISAE